MKLEEKNTERIKQRSTNDKIKYMLKKHKVELCCLFFAILYKWTWIDKKIYNNSNWWCSIHKEYIISKKDYERAAKYYHDTESGTYRNLTSQDLQSPNTR